MSDCDSIPFEDHKQILDAAEQRIAELEAKNKRLTDSMRAAEPVNKRRWERLQELEDQLAETQVENKRLESGVRGLQGRVAELEAENLRLRDTMKAASASARQIGHDERFTGHSVAQGLEKAL